MSHIIYGDASSMASSDPDWYPVAAQVGKRVNRKAMRGDIVAVVSKTAGMGAPACFIPSLAEMHINTEAADLGDPDKVNFKDRLWRLTHAPAVGACDHEAAHARHTKWDPKTDLVEAYGATRKMVDVITTLEEPRIEAALLREYPTGRKYLRGCAMEIVGKDFKIADSRYGAATAAGLLLARVDAGVLSKAEARPFRTEIRKVLDDDTLDTLEAIWREHFRLADDDYAQMVVHAHDWLAALGEDPEDNSDLAGGGLIIDLPADGSGSGEGDGEGDGEDGKAEGMGGRIREKIAHAETRMDGEVVDAANDERWERAKAEAKADAERRAEAKGPHDAAFGDKGGKGGLHGYSPTGFAHLSHTRPPTDDELRAARTLARELEKIDYHDRAVTKVTSVVPPGRLRGRAAVQGAAMRARGLDPEVEVWRAKQRRRVDSTPLTIGFLGDISGSMSAAMEPLASSQWVVSTAGAHVDAKVASAHFGNRVHGITPVGVREDDVRLFKPKDGTEEFRAAALAIDKELNLLDGRGARLLFVASDAEFVADKDERYAYTWVPLAQRKGVAVFFLQFTSTMSNAAYGAKVIRCMGKSPAAVATLIGKAAIAEVKRIDQG